MIDTVLFDMGGTLEDIFTDDSSCNASAEGVIRILKSHGIELPNESLSTVRSKLAAGWDCYSEYRKPTDRELKPEEIWGQFVLKDFGIGQISIESFAEELAHMWEITYFHRSLRPRVIEMLNGLRDMNLKLGIISNTGSLFQVFQTLNEYGIRDYFNDVTLSSITGYRKPHPNIFKVSLCQMKSKAQNSVYIGDTFSRDIIGASKMGFAATFHIISKLTKSKDADVPKDIKATYEIDDIYDVYTIMKELVNKK